MKNVKCTYKFFSNFKRLVVGTEVSSKLKIEFHLEMLIVENV